MIDNISDKQSYLITPKDDALDRIEVVIGDDKDDNFQPQVKLMRWDNEVNASFRLLDEDLTTSSIDTEETIKSESSKTVAKFYELPISDELPDGGFEFNITFKEKPISNQVRFSISDKGLKYYYQPSLIDEPTKDDRIVTRTETDWFDKNNESFCHRPENVVGSYEVYSSEKKINYVNGKKYKCGKVFHIYRPRIEDSDGKKVWGELNISDGIMTVTIPQDFLDTAVYPVKHAAGTTFGYTSQGATWFNKDSDDLIGGVYESPSDISTADSITWWIRFNYNGSTPCPLKGVLVLDSSLNIVSNGIGDAVSVPDDNTFAERTSSFSTKPSVSTLTDYLLMGIRDSVGGGSMSFSVTSAVSGEIIRYDNSNNYDTPTNPTDAGSYSNWRASVYCTYTAGGSSVVKDIIGGGLIAFPRA